MYHVTHAVWHLGKTRMTVFVGPWQLKGVSSDPCSSLWACSCLDLRKLEPAAKMSQIMGSTCKILVPEVCVIASAQTAEHYASSGLELSALLA